MVDRLVNTNSNHKRIAYVEQCFGAAGQKLTLPGRVLVGEGVLTKMCRKKPKPRQFFLFNDIFVYGNIIISKKRYNKQHIIPLDGVKLEDIEDEGNLRNGWKILSPMKSFVVYAATSSEKSEWMSHIRKCVSDLLKKRGIVQKSDNCPVWVPDTDAPVCMLCKKYVFSVINRRHHCRKCGIVVCNPCSSKKMLLPQQSSKLQRVCNNCFETNVDSDANTNAPSADIYSPSAGDDDSSGDESSDEEDERNSSYLDNANNTDIQDQQVQFYEQESM